ncbi:hypothetical protein [Ornithinibacillus halophilus]|uniref:Uncharacterized protein n=1 Tax=Ornithinibacillus halophilus TaxID=930117 RepID=A0A1M5G2G9_9BACI|nr:hypothetical protein [Ornithinibacillus halophilus]SHF97919.1 hypothetical protein SAMN05216225_101137 [Ornithinibacillus halophilus]
MKQFINLETNLISKWYGNEIDIFLEESDTRDRIELLSLLSEKVEELIMNDLQLITEGYISEVIHNSINKIDYNELLDYYIS